MKNTFMPKEGKELTIRFLNLENVEPNLPRDYPCSCSACDANIPVFRYHMQGGLRIKCKDGCPICELQRGV